MKNWPSQAVMPVLANPSPTTNSAATMMTVESENPANACLLVRMPVTNKASSDSSATRSARSRLKMNSAIVTPRIRKVRIMGRFSPVIMPVRALR